MLSERDTAVVLCYHWVGGAASRPRITAPPEIGLLRCKLLHLGGTRSAPRPIGPRTKGGAKTWARGQALVYRSILGGVRVWTCKGRRQHRSKLSCRRTTSLQELSLRSTGCWTTVYPRVERISACAKEFFFCCRRRYGRGVLCSYTERLSRHPTVTHRNVNSART